jgi:hypothetical protein
MLAQFALAALLVLGSGPTPPPGACAVTPPNRAAIPPAVAVKAGIIANEYTYGNGTIWTSLWPDGTVIFRKNGPGFVLQDGSLQMKYLWVLATDGPLRLSGRRLDAAAPPLKSDFVPAIGRGFQPSYVIFPTAGCWEVTAKANGSELTFVTKVVKTF